LALLIDDRKFSSYCILLALFVVDLFAVVEDHYYDHYYDVDDIQTSFSGLDLVPGLHRTPPTRDVQTGSGSGNNQTFCSWHF